MTTPRNAEVSKRPAELLRWSAASSEGEMVVTLVGEVDLSTADTLSDVLQGAMDGPPARLAVDLAQVSFLDSTGIRCLVDAAAKSSELGCRLVVRNPTPSIARVFAICGVDQLLLEQIVGKAAKSLAS